MRRARVALGLVAVLALAGFAEAQEVKVNPKDFYPLEVGRKWYFKVAGQDEPFVITCSKMEKVGDQNCARMDAAVKGQVVATEHLAALKDGIYRFKFGESVIEPPINFCKLPAKKGDTWSTEFKVGNEKASVTFETDIEEITVPAGKFKTVVVRGVVTEKGNKIKTTYWFAPKVGMVKQTIDFGPMQITLELQKTEGPKEKE